MVIPPKRLMKRCTVMMRHLMTLSAFLKAASEISKCCIADVHHYTRNPLTTLSISSYTEKRDQIINIFRKDWFTQ